MTPSAKRDLVAKDAEAYQLSTRRARRANDARRFGTVEPVFANLRHHEGLGRFTLRGRTKVDGQWRLDCLAHDIETLANAGLAA